MRSASTSAAAITGAPGCRQPHTLVSSKSRVWANAPLSTAACRYEYPCVSPTTVASSFAPCNAIAPARNAALLSALTAANAALPTKSSRHSLSRLHTTDGTLSNPVVAAKRANASVASFADESNMRLLLHRPGALHDAGRLECFDCRGVDAEFRQHLSRMLAEYRRPQLVDRFELRRLRREVEHLDLADRAIHFLDQVPRLDGRMIQRFTEVVHGAGRNAKSVETLQPVRPLASADRLADSFVECAAVGEAQCVGSKSLVIDHVRAFDCLTELAPHLHMTAAGSHDHHALVSAWIGTIRRHRVMMQTHTLRQLIAVPDHVREIASPREHRV